MGEASLDESQGALDDRFAPCTDAIKCCAKEDLVCTGDPDSTMTCTCTGLWDCSKNPKKCEQPMPVPGDGSWVCTWSEGEYTCTGKPKTPGKPGTKGLPGGNAWECKPGPGGSWTCTSTSPPNPSNKPDGGAVWDCQVNNELDTLSCEKNGNQTPPGTTPPGTTPPGTTPPTTPTTPTTPPETPATPTPPSETPPVPPAASECKPGVKMWCDGLQYCGWGQVVCGPDGKWKRKGMLAFLGIGELDCQELSDGSRPATTCACYHTYFNPKCCETPDCIVPAGSNGQICPQSAGNLCDYCNAQKPGCQTPGGECVVTVSGETFCGQGCGGGAGCPAGYKCMNMQTKNGPTAQCMPSDLSCFF
jgi:hypothetical protein